MHGIHSEDKEKKKKKTSEQNAMNTHGTQNRVPKETCPLRREKKRDIQS